MWFDRIKVSRFDRLKVVYSQDKSGDCSEVLVVRKDVRIEPLVSDRESTVVYLTRAAFPLQRKYSLKGRF